MNAIVLPAMAMGFEMNAIAPAMGKKGFEMNAIDSRTSAAVVLEHWLHFC